MSHRRKRFKSSKSLVFACFLLFALLVAGGVYYWSNLELILKGDYARAEDLQEEGEYEKALHIFENLGKRHPNFELADKALFNTGEILNFDLQRYHEAILAYLTVEKNYPDSPMVVRALQRVAAIYKNRLRDYPRAIISFQKILDQGVVQGDRMQYEVADCYFRLNNFEQARIEFESLLKSYPETAFSAEVQYRVAVSSSLEGDLGKALSAFKLVIEKWPESPYALEARFGLAGVLEEREELTAALAELKRLKKIYPNPEVLEKRISQ
ncbi:MAG: tetratricopeptide repeat protein, partial [Desulfuromonadaceae bacterium]